MYVAVVHKISDPEKFWSLGGFPDGISVKASYQDPTGTKAVCLFEASSVAALRDVLDGATSAVSDNDYFEVAPDKALGLPA
jgi:hypothetical protein